MIKLSFLSGFLLAGSIFGFANAEPESKTMASEKIEWNYNIDAQTRVKLWSMAGLQNDLEAIYKSWNISYCPNSDDYFQCLQSSPHKNKNDIFDVVYVGMPDLNNDQKPDLVLYLGTETGFSGDGRCAIMNVWFYENIGNDYRNIGKTEFVVTHNISIGPKKKVGHFRDIISQSNDDFCFNNKNLLNMTDKYDYNKKSYYDTEIK